MEAVKLVALAAAVGGVLGFAHQVAARMQQARRIKAAHSVEHVGVGGG
jgi:hypothetical protein